jgi:hypothetical protein
MTSSSWAEMRAALATTEGDGSEPTSALQAVGLILRSKLGRKEGEAVEKALLGAVGAASAVFEA